MLLSISRHYQMAVAGAQAIVFHGFRIGDAFGQRSVGAFN